MNEGIAMKKILSPLKLPGLSARAAALAARAVLFRSEMHCKAAGLHRKPHKALRRGRKSTSVLKEFEHD